MSEEFKRKLQAYKEGSLSDAERAEVEKELEKMELYQTYLDDLMGEEENSKQKNDVPGKEQQKQARILRRGKWKARMQNALTTLGILLTITMVSGVLTALFYALGEPSRGEVYRNVVESTIAVTDPNVSLGSSGVSSNFFFTMNLDADLNKQIGNDVIKTGAFSTKFIFNWPLVPDRDWRIEETNRPLFFYPSDDNDVADGSEWRKLEKLPEGTVAEAYLSFDRLYATDEILKKMEGKEFRPAWFAADTGLEKNEREEAGGPVFYPFGLPYMPIWHEDDYTVLERTEEKGFFGTVVSESGEYPAVEAYGSAELRNENFIKTLELMANYEHIAKNVATNRALKLEERIDYLKSNGVNVYGAVVTGPSKEILKLQEEEWVEVMEVGEVRFWNW